jgi:acyl dehydratase
MIGRPIADLKIGDTAELSRTISAQDVRQVVTAVGDDNPLHSDEAFAAATPFGRPIAPGILTAGLVSAVIGTRLPGPGCLYVSQDLRFLRPVMVGDTITARVEIIESVPERNRIRLKTVCVNERGEEVLTGEAWIKPPKERLVYTGHTSAGQTLGPPWAWGAAVVSMYSRMALFALAGGRPGVTT